MTDYDDHLVLAGRLTGRLGNAIERVTLEEFREQEALFDEDSHSGRELLYLASNVEWSRGTREVMTLDAADSVDTAVRVHVDLSRVTHEAFRDRTDLVWLPLLLLPPARPYVPGAIPTASPIPEPSGQGAPTPQVFDAAGAAVPSLPQSQARRWMAAALAEILLTMAPLTEPATPHERVVRREHRLLLSAAVYRVLREGGDSGDKVSPSPTDPPANSHSRSVIGRLEKARQELRDLVKGFVSLIDQAKTAKPSEAEPKPSAIDRSALLITRAARVLNAVSTPTTLVVIGVSAPSTSAVFTVQLPSIRLSRVSWARLHSSRARLSLDLVLADGDADRTVEIQLPQGVSYSRQPGKKPAVSASIKVTAPRRLRHVGDLMEQLGLARSGDSPVLRCVADFSLTQIDVARDLFRYHRLKVDEARRAPLVEVVPEWMDQLRDSLIQAGQNPTSSAWSDVLTHSEAGAGHIATPLYRNLEADAVGPRTAHVRVPAIENRAVRTTPIEAKVELDIVVDESGPLHHARYSGLMSLLILITVLVGLYTSAGKHDTGFDAQVLGGVLTLFAVIQAGRIEHPDQLSLRGLLISGSSPIILASILPTVLLGIELGFFHHWPATYLTITACVAQAGLLLGMQTDKLPHWLARPFRPENPQPRLQLATNAVPDYERTDVLRSSWWRSTTAGALLLGRQAHGYVVQQHGNGVIDLLGSEREPILPQPVSNLGRRGINGLNGLFKTLSNGDDEPDDAANNGVRWLANLVGKLNETERAGPDTTLIDTPANILALLRAGTAQSSLTFVVFREEPDEVWRSKLGARKVDLDADQLTATEASVGNLDILIGLNPRDCAPIADHPLTGLLQVIKRHHRQILDVQLPCPPPRGGARDRTWMRVRIGLRANEIATLTSFLDAVHRTVRTSHGEDVDLLIDMTAQTPPRRYLGAELPPGSRDATLRPGELDVVARIADDHPGTEWLVTAICGYAHNGVEIETLLELARQQPELQLVGLASALLHGTSPMLILGRRPGRTAAPEPAPDQQPRVLPPAQARSVPADPVSPARPATPPALEFKHRQVVIEDWVPAATLGTHQVGTGLLLRVHARCSDRPGMLSAMVEEIGRGLAQVAGVNPAPNVPVWFVHTDVVDGRRATSRLLVRLPPELEAAAENRFSLDRVERVVQQALINRLEPNARLAERGEWIQARAVVSIDVVTAAALSLVDLTTTEQTVRTTSP